MQANERFVEERTTLEGARAKLEAEKAELTDRSKRDREEASSRLKQVQEESARRLERLEADLRVVRTESAAASERAAAGIAQADQLRERLGQAEEAQQALRKGLAVEQSKRAAADARADNLSNAWTPPSRRPGGSTRRTSSSLPHCPARLVLRGKSPIETGGPPRRVARCPGGLVSPPGLSLLGKAKPRRSWKPNRNCGLHSRPRGRAAGRSTRVLARFDNPGHPSEGVYWSSVQVDTWHADGISTPPLFFSAVSSGAAE